MKNFFRRLSLFVTLNLFVCSAFAWDNSIELGYGYSHDPNNVKYNNSAIQLTSDLFPVYRGDYTFWSITGTLGQWHSTAPTSQNLTAGAFSMALRLYPFTSTRVKYPFYLLGSVGPALISSRQFGVNHQASNLTIQTNLGLGAEFHSFDVNLRLAHYSNANLGNPNQGYNVLYLLSLGYLF